MTFLTSRLCRFAVGLLLLLALGDRARAAESSSAPYPRELVIKITAGKMTQGGSAAEVPATLANIVAALQAEYRDAAITLVGVEDVLIDNLTLRIGARRGSLRTAIAALAEASGRRIRVQDFGEGDFVLAADRAPVSHRAAEVFNLGPLLSNNVARQLDLQLREAEMHLAAVRKVMGNDAARIAQINTEIEMLKARKAQVPAPLESGKVIEQIREMVGLTMALLKTAEKAPEFQFHPGTNLLIVIGGDDAIEVTRKVVSALERSAN